MRWVGGCPKNFSMCAMRQGLIFLGINGTGLIRCRELDFFRTIWIHHHQVLPIFLFLLQFPFFQWVSPDLLVLLYEKLVGICGRKMMQRKRCLCRGALEPTYSIYC